MRNTNNIIEYQHEPYWNIGRNIDIDLSKCMFSKISELTLIDIDGK